MDKDLLERAWVPLSDIPTAYDEFLETFHHKHKSLPRPSAQALKMKCCVVENDSFSIPFTPTDPVQNVPTPSSSSTPCIDPLAFPHRSPTPPFNPDHLSYIPPPITTTCSKRKSCALNLHHITDLITTNLKTPQRSS